MSSQSLKIISLEASNVKRLTAVAITPQGNLITISGANGAGKSSVLDSIWYTLAGKDSIPVKPIREGATRAESTVKLGDSTGKVVLVATRVYTSKGTTITVSDPEGHQMSTPQTLLDRLVATLSFDPIAFARMAGTPDGRRRQVEILRKLVGLDFSKLDSDIATAEQVRSNATQVLNSEKAKLAAMIKHPDAPKEKVDIADVVAQLEKAGDHNKKNREARNGLDDLKIDLKNHKEELERASRDLEEAQRNYEAAKLVLNNSADRLSKLEEDVKALKDVDEAPLREKLKSAEGMNAKVRDNEQYDKTANVIEKCRIEEAKRQEWLDSLRQRKTTLLAEAKFPLPGLSFDPEGVVYNGLPFSQASTAEQLRVSVAIGMASNPQLRVMFVRDGSLLDENGLKIVAEMADKNDYQIWMEDARSKDKTAIVIEDGHIKQEQA